MSYNCPFPRNYGGRSGTREGHGGRGGGRVGGRDRGDSTPQANTATMEISTIETVKGPNMVREAE